MSDVSDSIVQSSSDVCNIFDTTKVDGEVLVSADSELFTQLFTSSEVVDGAASNVTQLFTSSEIMGNVTSEPSLQTGHRDGALLQGYDKKSSYMNDTAGFQCDICEKSFRTESFMRVHKSNSHSVQLPSERTDSEESEGESYSHRTLSEDSTTFPCDLCSSSFSRISLLRNHRVKAHGVTGAAVPRNIPDPKGAYYCDSCNKMFVYNSYLKIHKKSHEREARGPKVTYPCRYCKRKFVSLYARHRHMMTTHGDNSQQDEFDCPVCSKSYSLAGLVRHVRVAHATIPSWSYACETCGSLLKNQARLRWHRWKYHGAGLANGDCQRKDLLRRICLKCNRDFETNELSAHWKLPHWLACSICNLVYVSDADREKHWVEEHGLNVSTFPSLSSLSSLTPESRSSSGTTLSASETSLPVSQMNSSGCDTSPSRLPTEASNVQSARDSKRQLSSPVIVLKRLSPGQTQQMNSVDMKQEPVESMSSVKRFCNSSASVTPNRISSMVASSPALHTSISAAAADRNACSRPAAAAEERKKSGSSLSALAARAKVLSAAAERLARIRAKLSSAPISSSSGVIVKVEPESSSNNDVVITEPESSSNNDDANDVVITKYSVKNARRTKASNTIKSSHTVAQETTIKSEPVDYMDCESSSIAAGISCDVTEDMTDYSSVVTGPVTESGVESVGTDMYACPDTVLQTSNSGSSEEVLIVKPVQCWRKADLSIFACIKSLREDVGRGLTDETLCDVKPWGNENLFYTPNSNTQETNRKEKYVCGLCGQLYEWELYVKMCYMSHCGN